MKNKILTWWKKLDLDMVQFALIFVCWGTIHHLVGYDYDYLFLAAIVFALAEVVFRLKQLERLLIGIYYKEKS